MITGNYTTSERIGEINKAIQAINDGFHTEVTRTKLPRKLKKRYKKQGLLAVTITTTEGHVLNLNT